MKHNFSFLPSLRRTTLLALLCLGIMPAFADYTVYFNSGGPDIWEKDEAVMFCMTWEGGTEKHIMMTPLGDCIYKAEGIPTNNNQIKFQKYPKGTTQDNYKSKNWDAQTDGMSANDLKGGKNYYIKTGTNGNAGRWDVYVSCIIPTTTTIYVDVTNFTGGYSGSTYYLSLVSQSNSTIDLNNDKDNYKCKEEIEWYKMTQVSSTIYSATIDETNIGMISVWNKDIHDYNNPNEVNIAGQVMYDCDNEYNLFTISNNPTQGTNIYLFTGTWSTYSPVVPCTNCEYLGQ